MDAMQLAVEADLEYRLQTANALMNDDVECATYLIRNRKRLLPRMMFTQQKFGGDICQNIAHFVKGVHERHLAGKPIN